MSKETSRSASRFSLLNKWYIAGFVLIFGGLGSFLLVASHADPLTTANHMIPGQQLLAGNGIVSSDGGVALRLQVDGNLVIYNRQNVAVWNAGTWHKGGVRLVFQASDGNLVLYTAAGKAVWNAPTYHKSGVNLIIQNDANLVMYTAAGKAVWATNTAGKQGSFPVSGPVSGPVGGPVSAPVN